MSQMGAGQSYARVFWPKNLSEKHGTSSDKRTEEQVKKLKKI